MKLSEKLGIKPGDSPTNSKVSQALRRAGVRKSPEFDRILALPRRLFDADAYPDATPLYARGPCGVAGCRYCATGAPVLRPLQSSMIIEAAQNNGLFANVGVGEGKTLASLLMHSAMNAKRTALLVPASCRDKTLKYDLPDLNRHYILPDVFGSEQAGSGRSGVYVVAYTDLSATDSSDLLDKINPDLIVADEAHSLRHKDAARTRRFLRYMRKNPCAFVCMSGTLATRAVTDYAHLIELALRKNSPVPVDYPTLMEWNDAIVNEDRKANGGEFGHTEPGVLVTFCNPGETIRSGFRRRQIDTAGVISTVENSCGANLVIKILRPKPPAVVSDALKELDRTWAWNGEEFSKAIDIARLNKEFIQGFFYELVWPGGVKDEAWIQARNGWNRAIRERLSRTNREGEDSPALLEAMAEAGDWTPGEWFDWLKQRDKPEPGRRTIEKSRWLVAEVLTWIKQGPGIIWIDSPTVGEWIAEEGIPYFGAGTDAELLEFAARPDAGQHAIACSIQAHGTGKNLQAWSRNLVTYPPGSGAIWEQMIGRTHRSGQDADTVYVDLILASRGADRAWESAKWDARFVKQTWGQNHRLLVATVEDCI